MSGFDLVASSRSDWKELEELLARGPRNLSPDELSRLDVLYRRTTVHLARVSTQSADPHLADYLNRLAAKAHSVIYVSPRRRFLAGTWKFLTNGFPMVVARHAKMHLLSALLFLGAAFFGYVASSNDLETAYALSNPADPRQPGSTTEQLQDFLRLGRDTKHGEHFFFASFLFQNNLKVAIMALATGVLAGVPTVLILVTNGLMLGQFVAVHDRDNLLIEMWAWILPHGIPELSAIVLAGGTGFVLGKALLMPGMMSRTESLKQAGKEAAQMVIGLALMLLLAAIIESYVRQSHLTTAQRLWFAAGNGIFWTMYFGRGFLLIQQQSASHSAAERDYSVLPS